MGLCEDVAADSVESSGLVDFSWLDELSSVDEAAPPEPDESAPWLLAELPSEPSSPELCEEPPSELLEVCSPELSDELWPPEAESDCELELLFESEEESEEASELLAEEEDDDEFCKSLSFFTSSRFSFVSRSSGCIFKASW